MFVSHRYEKEQALGQDYINLTEMFYSLNIVPLIVSAPWEEAWVWMSIRAWKKSQQAL